MIFCNHKEITSWPEVISVRVTRRVKQRGDYNWEGLPGMITGMSVKTLDGEVIFACTAEGCYAESVPMKLKAGTYEIEMVYLTNDEDMRAFLVNNGIDEIGSDPYTYIENGALTFRSTNLFCALLFLEIFVVLLLKHIKDGKEE